MNSTKLAKWLFTILTICISSSYFTAFSKNSTDSSSKSATNALVCEIFDLVVEPLPCNPNGVFSVELDFQFVDVSDAFNVSGNGTDYGNFQYADLPITISGLEGDGLTVYEFVVTDANDPNCQTFDQIQVVDCNTDCEITNASVDLVCLNNGGLPAFATTINLEANNAAGMHFSIAFGDNPSFISYPYESFPITINVVVNTTFIVITSDEDENCTFIVDIDFPDCACDASNYTYDFLGCTNDGWELEIDFDYGGIDEDFEVSDNDGNLLGTFNTSQLPITVEAPLSSFNGTRLHFCFLTSECCTFEDFTDPFCNGTCHIFNENITTSDCDVNGNVTLTFDFDYENTSDSFYIIIYDLPPFNYGPFAYTDLPVDLPNLEADGVLYIIDIVDNEPNPSSNCRVGIDYQDVPNCFGPDECMINEVLAEANCNSEGTYDLSISLEIENTQDNEFNVFIATLGNFGPFSINDFPLTIENLDINFDNPWVTVTDVNDQGCNGLDYFELPQCEYCVGFDNLEAGFDYVDLEEGDTLTIENDVVVTVANNSLVGYIQAVTDPFCGPFPAANGIHVFMARTLNFDFSNINSVSNSVSFDFHTCDPGGELSVNGNAYTSFFYFNSLDTTFTLNSGHIVQVVRNPNVNWEGHVTITGAVEILSIQGVELAIDNICYQVAPPPCDITDLVVEAQNCDNNGNFILDIDFNATSPSDSFYVTVNTLNQGSFAYADLPISVGPFEGNGQPMQVIVHDFEDQDCWLQQDVEAPGCIACVLTSTSLNEDCNDDGFFYIQYVTANNDPNAVGYQVLVDNELYGEYTYDQSTVTIGPLEGNGQLIVLSSVDINDPECFTSYSILAPDCNAGVCSITGFEISPPECNPEGGYNLTINFNYENPGNDFFDLFDSNGELIGFYSLNDLPITLENYFPVLNGFDAFQVCINDNPNCCASYSTDFPNCNDPCVITDLIVEAYDCDPNGLFLVDLDFNYTGTSDSFSVVGNGTNYGNFAYTDLFITLGPFAGNGQILEFIVTDLEFQDCSAEVGLEAPNCNTGVCSISNLETSIPECNPEGGYNLTINFDYENPGNDFFDLFNSDGELIGFYSLNDLPITLENYTPSFPLGEVFTVCINDNPNCCQLLTVAFPECNDPCVMAGLIVEASDCTPNNVFFVDLGFDYANTSDSFSVVGNGTNYGNFAYTDLFITLGPFAGNGQILEFIVTDLEFQDCSSEVVFEAPDCNTGVCSISNLETSIPECNPEGGYNLTINFDYENPGNDFFDLFNSDGELIGFYSLNDLPITLENYTPSFPLGEVFTVCINDNPNCCQLLTVAFPECNDPCVMAGLIVEAYDCDPNGLFFVDLGFDYANTSDSFSVVGNGTNYGNFAYTDLFITLGPFAGNGQILEFIVTDLEFQDCSSEIVLEAPDCNTGVCSISNLETSIPECNPEGGYDLTINFDYENPGNDFFDLFNSDGELIGFYSLNDLPITLENYTPSFPLGEVFTVCINDNSNCCQLLTVAFPECNDPCVMAGLIVEAYDCDPNGLFFVDLDFSYTGTSDSFDVYIDGDGMDDYYGTYAYSDLYITIGPFEGNGQFIEFLVVDQNDANCWAPFTLEAPDCNANCEIGTLQVTNTPCNPNGIYSVGLDFDYANGSDSFQVFIFSELYGTFAYSDLPVDLGSYDIVQIQTLDVVVVDLENPECVAESLYVVDCDGSGEDCLISNLEFAPFCDDGMLFAEVIFDYNGNGSDSFQILSCAPIGTFAYNASGVYTIQIPEDLVNCAGGVFIPIGIFDQENNACGDTEFLFIPDCYETGCQIDEIISTVSDCDGDVFTVTLDFEFQDVGDDGFQVLGNGTNYGDFGYNELPITLGPFAGTGQDFEFIIIDNDDDDCWNFTEITAPDCAAPLSSCIEFEGLTDGLNYGGSNSQPGDLLMVENEVLVTMEGVPDPLGNLNYDYMFATTQDICNPFDAASGNRVFMFNGLRFDFSPLPQNPTVVSFPFHNCGIPFAISVNDQVPVTYLLPQSDTIFNLSPNVVIDIELDGTNSEEGVITLQGFVASFFIGGVELQIDNVCFNVETLEVDVWPGDANYDNIANHFDLLNIGIAFGINETERTNISTDWFAMPAENWSGFYADEETNYKHADCDGNGIVEMADRAAILSNYNLEHGPTPIFVQLPGTPEDPPFFVDLPDAPELIGGNLFEAPIILGTPNIPVEDIYGIAFTVSFDAEMMDEDQVTIELGDSWMGVDGQNLIHLDKKFASEGTFEVAVTRTNQENTSGSGPIGHFIGIIDDILGRTEVEVTITNVKAIMFDQTPVPLYLESEIVDLTTDNPIDPQNGELLIYPNPTIDVIHIDNQTGENIKKVKVYNALGQLITVVTNPQPYESIQVSDWAAGVYFVKLELDARILTRRIKKTTK